MTFNNTALVLIDWQQSFRIDQDFWGPRNNPDAQPKAEALTKAWRTAGLPIYVVKHNSVGSASPLRPDQPGNALEEFAQPQEGEGLYEKTVNSGFIGTRLEADLKAEGITQLVISGVTTAHCVSTTTRMAANLGFEVILVEDACFTHAAKGRDGAMISADTMHDTQVAALRDEFASIAQASSIIESL